MILIYKQKRISSKSLSHNEIFPIYRAKNIWHPWQTRPRQSTHSEKFTFKSYSNIIFQIRIYQ